MNENYAHPRCRTARSGHPEGNVPAARRCRGKVRVNLLGSGTILREVIGAAELLEAEFGVPADVFSVTSFSELRREALDAERWNLLHPGRRRARRTCRSCSPGNRVRSSRRRTTCARAGPDPAMVPGRYHVLGTDGYGRSDSRAALRASSKSTGATSRSRRSSRSPTRECSTWRRS